MIIERILFYGTIMPISLLATGLCFYVTKSFYDQYHKNKNNPYLDLYGKYDWVPMFLLGVCALIGTICFVIGFEYGVIKVIEQL